MVLSEAAEKALNSAVEAFYVAQFRDDDDAYLEKEQEYLRLTSEQWWKKQCDECPGCSRCLEYDC